MPKLSSFEDCAAGLTKLGAEFYREGQWGTLEDGTRGKTPRPYFSSVFIPFSHAQWFAIASGAGSFYIGGCCGAASAIQNIVCSWFRHADEGVSPKDLSELAQRQANHHEPYDEDENSYNWVEMDDEQVFAYVDKYGAYLRGEIKTPSEDFVVDPWFVLCLMWHLVKNHYVLDQPEKAKPDHISPLDKSLRIVESVSLAFMFDRVFSKAENASKVIPESQEKVNRIFTLYRFLPAIKHVYEEAHTLYSGPFEGWAIIDKSAGDKGLTFAKNGGGYCFYETKEEVEAIFDLWQKQQDDTIDSFSKKLPVRERLGVRPIRVTIEDGVVLTDTGEKYAGKNV